MKEENITRNATTIETSQRVKHAITTEITKRYELRLEECRAEADAMEDACDRNNRTFKSRTNELELLLEEGMFTKIEKMKCSCNYRKNTFKFEKICFHCVTRIVVIIVILLFYSAFIFQCLV